MGLTKISTTAELEKEQADLRSVETPLTGARTWSLIKATGKPRRYGWPSRLRSYLIYDPCIWAYTLILGTISLIVSLFDRNGRMQHNLARLWSWLIMKTILSPVTVTGPTW